MIVHKPMVVIFLAVWLIVGASVFWPQVALAHRSGCHNLHTCPSDTGSYICGDLGYPCDGSTSAANIAIAAINVPLVVEKAFTDTFGRNPTVAESAYWKNRFRNDKDGLYKIRRTMAWHKEHNSFGPLVKVTVRSLIKDINEIFRSVYDGRNPTPSENKYWISRVADKPTREALLGAMAWHKINNIQH